jgi:Nickel/cobalt transporter regulator
MRTLKLSVLALALAMTPGVAFAGGESNMGGHMKGMTGIGKGHMPRPTMGMPHMGGHIGGMPKAGKPMHGRPMYHHGGFVGKRGGHGYMGKRFHGHQMNGYRRPFRGYALPSYWVQPSFYIPNYSYYGFAQPSAGYGWSRYYNDAVLTDRYGRVYDSVYDVNWDGYGDRYDDRYDDDGYYDRDDRRYRDSRRGGRSGIGGAIAGGAIGAIAGSAIAGRGERLAGGLIGGGLGAIAGTAIDQASRSDRYRPRRGRDIADDRAYPSVQYGGDPGGRAYSGTYDRSAADGGRYNGRWTGQWEGQYESEDGRVYNGTYEGTYDTGGASPHWSSDDDGARYPAPRPAPAPAPRLSYPGNGYGWGYEPQVTTVTIQPQPVTTTTTTTYIEEEVYYTPVKKRYVAKRPHKVWRPKPKPRCVCKVVYR